MQVFRNIPEGRDILGWPPVVAALVVAALALAVSSGRILLRERALARERSTAAERSRELSAENRRLRETVPALDSPETIERLAKERLNLKNPDEQVVVVAENQEPRGSNDEPRSLLLRIFTGWLRPLGEFFRR